MANTVNADIIVLGGGIAGLWSLAKLRAYGYNAVLCETEALGKGQTIASQGIIHGGTKYSLTGQLSESGRAISAMPGIWKEALAGRGALDLSGVRIASQSQLLWTSRQVTSKITGFFASKVMKSRMQALSRAEYPQIFNHKQFHGTLYRLDEPVLDVVSLLEKFKELFEDYLYLLPDYSIDCSEDKEWPVCLSSSTGAALKIKARHLVLAAGLGNIDLLDGLGIKSIVMQRRPLQMIMAKGELPLIHAHALGSGTQPLLTITSHIALDNSTVWYIGGQPAEKGVGVDAKEVIELVRQELERQFPWMSFKGIKWTTWNVVRAEGSQEGGKRPAEPIVKTEGNVSVIWPTKLAFAPVAASKLLQDIENKVEIGGAGNIMMNGSLCAAPSVAVPPWNRESVWN